MAENDGNFKADISDKAIADALRSVERGGEPDEEGELLDVGGEPSGSDEVRKLKAMLDDSASRAQQTQERLKETHDRYLRVAADFENWKKRTAKEKDDAQKFGNEKLLKDLLPVLDNLERALSAGGDTAALLEGVRLVARQFGDTIGRYGAKSFTSVGQPFDPARHEALMQQESADVAPNTVLSEMVKGYTLADRLIRPAAVVVAKAPQKAPQAAPDGDGTTPAEGG